MFDVLTLLAQEATDKAEVVDKAAETASSTDTQMWITLGIGLALIVVPFILGEILARMLKLRDLNTRIGVVLLAVSIGLSPFLMDLVRQARQKESLNQVSLQETFRNTLRPGVDLAGGMNLVFEVDVELAERQGKEVTSQVMDQMVGAISRRINPSGTEEVTVRKVGNHKIEVIIPEIDPAAVDVMEKRITQLGSLEFAVLATNRNDSSLVEKARRLSNDEFNIVENGEIKAAWKPVGKKDGEYKSIGEYGDVISRTVSRDVVQPDGTTRKESVPEFLVVYEPVEKRVTGQYLTSASPTRDPDTNQLAVSFRFNSTGAYLFSSLTSKHRPRGDFERRLSIILNEELHQAPNLKSVISSQGQITGDFDQAEIEELTNVLNAGALQVPLKDSPRRNIVDPTLGRDVREKGINAILIAAAAVVVFMLIYYRLSGVIADLSLVLNLILLVGTMSFIDATFSLPGLAGIVLTIGMAVDANVLIYERMREELNRGSSLRMAIHNGFDRAFLTIVDSNLTTLITAVVLYIIGTDQIKGFAVTLFIGIVISMFTALYFGRLMFDILERKRWIKSLNMMSLIRQGTNWDFVGKTKMAIGVSLVLITLGLVAFASRGKENFDIDFTGGSMVSFEFVEEQSLEKVRDALEEQFESAITVESLKAAGEQGADEVRRYRLRTRESKEETVRQNVNDAFAGKGMELRHVSVEVGKVEPIPEAEGAKATLAFKTQGQTSGELVDTEVPQPTVSSYIVNQLIKIPNPDGPKDAEGNALPKYTDETTASALINVTGTKGTGLERQKGMTRQYYEFEVTSRKGLDQADFELALNNVKQQLDSEPYFPEEDTFDTSVAGEMQQQALTAILLSLIAMTAYIWFRFERLSFGIAAVIALVHDVLITVGLIALGAYLSRTPIGPFLGLEDFKINLPMIAAILTLVGFSINDTIVIFDRIREVRGKNPALTADMVNRSLNQTLSRTILTTLTVFMVVVILYALGGEGIHGFAYCLVVGLIAGTWSTVYIASPILVWMMNRPGARSVRTGLSRPVAESTT